jgi:CRP-like cAMP-binding protein
VRDSRKAVFDPRIFLAEVGDGKSISKYERDQVVFSQGDAADAVFYIQRGKIKLTSFPSGARKQSLEFWHLVTFLARDVSMGIRYESQPLRRSSHP